MRSLIVGLFMVTLLSAQTNFNKVGTAGVLFLNIPVSAASQGMGRAYSGIEQGASATFWNPALLGFEKKSQLFIGYTSWLLGLHHQAAAYCHRVGRYGVGFSQVLLTTEPMTRTTSKSPRGTGDTFRYFDIAIGLSLSRAFSDQFALGGTIKYIQESVYTVKAQNFSIDIGSFYRIGYRDLRIFMVLRNFGPDMRFNGSFFDTRVKGNVKEEIELDYGEFALPTTFSIGLAATVWEGVKQSFTLAVEANHPVDYSQRLHVGGEFKQGQFLKFRGGYKLNYEQESWSLGCGLYSGVFRLDISYSAMKDFSNIISYSLHYNLN